MGRSSVRFVSRVLVSVVLASFLAVTTGCPGPTATKSDSKKSGSSSGSSSKGKSDKDNGAMVDGDSNTTSP